MFLSRKRVARLMRAARYLATAEGFLHLAAVEDLFSRAMVGWGYGR